MIDAVFSDLSTHHLVIVVHGEEYAVTLSDCEFILDCVDTGQAVAIES